MFRKGFSCLDIFMPLFYTKFKHKDMSIFVSGSTSSHSDQVTWRSLKVSGNPVPFACSPPYSFKQAHFVLTKSHQIATKPPGIQQWADVLHIKTHRLLGAPAVIQKSHKMKLRQGVKQGKEVKPSYFTSMPHLLCCNSKTVMKRAGGRKKKWKKKTKLYASHWNYHLAFGKILTPQRSSSNLVKSTASSW